MANQGLYTPRVNKLYRGTQIVWSIITVLETLFAFRLALRFLGANPGAGFTQFIYGITYPFVAPFLAVFRPTYITSGSVFEWTTLLAMFVYLLVGVGIIRLLAMGRPVSTLEAHEHLVQEDTTAV